MWFGLIALVVILGIAWWASRANELFYVSVRDGRVLVVRGAVPQALLNDFKAAVQKPLVKRGSIKCVKTQAGGQIYAGGDIDDFTLQRLRNIFRIYPVSNLRAAEVNGKRTLGQILGIAWLAWIFDAATRPKSDLIE